MEKNIEVILKHFNISNSEDWKVKEAFASEEVYFAAYYNKTKVDFILIEDLEPYLRNKVE